MSRIRSEKNIERDGRSRRRKWADNLKVVGLQLHEVYDLMNEGTAKLWRIKGDDAFIGNDKYYVRVPPATFCALKRHGVIECVQWTPLNTNALNGPSFRLDFALTRTPKSLYAVMVSRETQKRMRRNAEKCGNPFGKPAILF